MLTECILYEICGFYGLILRIKFDWFLMLTECILYEICGFYGLILRIKFDWFASLSSRVIGLQRLRAPQRNP